MKYRYRLEDFRQIFSFSSYGFRSTDDKLTFIIYLLIVLIIATIVK